ncbi:NPCBM/NEW2 domain-containing protein [Nocardia gamkensis]|uniref:NPCBM/NEW2 domain-containing protein n=1 Tax=Nocardia gamkensis TaxID=352869 RepID=UPI0033C48574
MWAIDQLTSADFVLVIASPGYKRRADGTAADQGRGAQFEAAIIRDGLTKDQAPRILPVVLPGRSIDEIPVFLAAHSTTYYEIREFTMEGINDLLATFTGNSELLTVALEPVVRGADLSLTGADLNGIHNGNSIVHRCTNFCRDSHSPIEYNLGRSYREFESVVGVLDDAVDAGQTGYFQVFLDGEAQPEVEVTYGEPVKIRYDVTGVLRLRLVAYRPDAPSSPMHAGAMATVGRSVKLPALAWATPHCSDGMPQLLLPGDSGLT